MNDSTSPVELAQLSENARRWALFFKLNSRRRARVAIAVGLISVGKRPGFTATIFDEINAWAHHPRPIAAQGNNVVTLLRRASNNQEKE